MTEEFEELSMKAALLTKEMLLDTVVHYIHDYYKATDKNAKSEAFYKIQLACSTVLLKHADRESTIEDAHRDIKSLNRIQEANSLYDSITGVNHDEI